MCNHRLFTPDIPSNSILFGSFSKIKKVFKSEKFSVLEVKVLCLKRFRKGTEDAAPMERTDANRKGEPRTDERTTTCWDSSSNYRIKQIPSERTQKPGGTRVPAKEADS